jgi:hypothetical protein
MGSSTGRWVGRSPTERKFPFEIAAKMARDIKAVKQDEAGQLITATMRALDKCDEQAMLIIELKKELSIAEQTVKLLQVEDS